MSGPAAQGLDELIDWGGDPELNPLDALMWRTERPPANSWTGVVVQILDTVPEWDRLLPVGPPMWTPDEDFDLSYHPRRVVLPAPGSMRQLLELAQTQALVPLDRNRPRWVAILVEGLEGGRSAVRNEPALDLLGAVTPAFNFVAAPIVTAALQNMTPRRC